MSAAEKQKRGFWSLITNGSIIIHLIVSAVWLVCVCGGVWWFIGIDLEAPLRPNEMGDFLAGAFSPLAFYWLIVGYWLQRQELQETRKEIQRQADAMTDQTGYLKDELELRIRLADEASAKSRIDAAEAKIKALLKRISKCLPLTLPNGVVIEKFHYNSGFPPVSGVKDDLLKARLDFPEGREAFSREITYRVVLNLSVVYFEAQVFYRDLCKEVQEIQRLSGDGYEAMISRHYLLRSWRDIEVVARLLFHSVDRSAMLQALAELKAQETARPESS
ncbi:hypothetical protein [Ponticaulis sp.]|uniref:hypothetical protein n=1 Tax=Ponticaulis sp. TaxID=2020902 RepID=UPI0026260ADB|nr:hypothetical protein [Ponticaulis sp.]MDF1681682.1 hypothetical protein [Ponticaulis sp.]